MKILAILLSAFLLTSCTTKMMWKKPVYVERINSFLITENGKKLVIIGKKYHYIFNVTGDLKTPLLSDIQKNISSRLYSYKVDNNNSISGVYELYYSSNNKNDIPLLEKLGFKKYPQKNKMPLKYFFRGEIKGTRYTANIDIDKSYKFYKTYSIRIEEPPSLLGTIGKILATPITLAADGLLYIGGSVVATGVGELH